LLVGSGEAESDTSDVLLGDHRVIVPWVTERLSKSLTTDVENPVAASTYG